MSYLSIMLFTFQRNVAHVSTLCRSRFSVYVALIQASCCSRLSVTLFTFKRCSRFSAMLITFQYYNSHVSELCCSRLSVSFKHHVVHVSAQCCSRFSVTLFGCLVGSLHVSCSISSIADRMGSLCLQHQDVFRFCLLLAVECHDWLVEEQSIK